ncbi:hypothetical protein Bcav_2524 [Beutenbergia cavernae DSM 12333]|uniref:Uncharacterized protein n=1 Tax=Beutenbergia cavernae (strain ATCC BAA-8 / DSM 12333 / CCUG 43141 / JCM 11478 / NBRC 16432 / NCIMB 13614 / HKI 0122) TaxID=471853 RepID=C5BWV6_BEUC1|nr:hypothetical protein [Beutenbergia cavernae]ACQ80772.1 hypothetical protein Bcav_2524 [Beutenbergia cavernae DSM 12333]
MKSFAAWLIEQTEHPDSGLAALARQWVAGVDAGRVPAAGGVPLVAGAVRDHRLLRALERAVAAFHVQHGPRVWEVYCSECGARCGFPCREDDTTRRERPHRDRRDRADRSLSAAIADDLQAVRLAQRRAAS